MGKTDKKFFMGYRTYKLGNYCGVPDILTENQHLFVECHSVLKAKLLNESRSSPEIISKGKSKSQLVPFWLAAPYVTKYDLAEPLCAVASPIGNQ